MRVSMIVAMDEKNGIASQGQLPWHLPAELKLFKQTTTGHHLLMGRKTFESIGRALPGRTTIVITRQQNYGSEGCLVAHSINEGLALAQSRGENEVFVCGGGEIFKQALPIVDRIYLTLVHTITSADITFPPFDTGRWQVVDSVYHPADGKNPFAFTRKVLDKKPATEPATEVDKP